MPKINKFRALIVKAFCPHCRKTIMPTEMANSHLKVGSKINIVDNFEWENFGVESNPVVNKVLAKQGEGYPTLIFDGLKLHGFLSKRVIEACLDALTENERVVGKERRWTQKDI